MQKALFLDAPGLERDIVVKIVKILGRVLRRSAAAGRLSITGTILAECAVTGPGTSTAGIQHLHFIGNDFSGIALDSILFPGTGLQAAFYI